MYQIITPRTNGTINTPALTDDVRFSWRLESDKPCSQKSYEIVLRDTEHRLVWDSGEVCSEEVSNIPYTGPKLKSASDYYWRVTSFSSTGEHADGPITAFTTGILDKSLWKAEWITSGIPANAAEDCTEVWKIMSGGVPVKEFPENDLNPAVYFRKEINISRKLKSAKLFATAHGIYNISVGGKKFGYPFAPGITQYKSYLEYQCYDVTEELHEGANVIGAVVADGWYRGKIGLLGIGNQWGDETALYMQLMVEYTDGTTGVFGTDSSFRCSTGAYIYADLFVGEGYDARLEPKGWDKPGYDDSSWKEVLLRPYGTDNFTGMRDNPPAFVREYQPAEIFTSPEGELIIDAGEVVSGFVSISAKAKAGVRISLEYGEVVDGERNFINNIIGQNKNQTDVYIANSNEPFEYRPLFTFHGFRYVRVTGLSPEDIAEVKVCVVASEMQRTSSMWTNDERINKLLDNIYRSQEGNMLYIPTDCPQREKNGFTGDMEIYSPAALLQMDMEAFLNKWFIQIRQEQRDNGLVPIIVPYVESTKLLHGGVEETSSAWGDAAVIIPYRIYKTYGDRKILSDNYDMMKRWLDFVRSEAETGIPDGIGELTEERREHQRYLWNTGHHFGDWLIPSLSRDGVSNPNIGAEMTKGLTAPAYYAYSVSLMTEIAEILGRTDDAEYYRTLGKKIKEAYISEYIDGSGILPIDYQGMYVLALYMNLIPEEQKKKYVDRLVKLIHDNNDCLDTGFVSLPYLLDTLYENGEKELAYTLLFRDECPSWLYEVKMGATSMWESWTNIAPDGTINNSSFNHFAFGVVADFIYRRILGLYALEPGYKKVRIAPDLECGLSHASGYFMSVYGKISISWSLQGEHAVLDVILPPNTSALVEFGPVKKEAANGRLHISF